MTFLTDVQRLNVLSSYLSNYFYTTFYFRKYFLPIKAKAVNEIIRPLAQNVFLCFLNVPKNGQTKLILKMENKLW